MCIEIVGADAVDTDVMGADVMGVGIWGADVVCAEDVVGKLVGKLAVKIDVCIGWSFCW